jgi:Flp pilus assembly protein CpaB
MSRLKINKPKLSGLTFIILAVICAFIAAFIVVQAGYRAAPTLSVLELTQYVTAGDYVEGKLKEVKIAKSSIPKGAIKPGADLSRSVVRHGLSEGDVLRVNHLIDDEIDGGLLSARLKALGDDTLRAVELPIESVAGMMGGMKAGDRVDVIAVYETGDGNDKIIESRTILTDRELVGVMTSEDGTGGALVVSVTVEEAQILASNMETGKIYIALKPFGKKGGN